MSPHQLWSRNRSAAIAVVGALASVVAGREQPSPIVAEPAAPRVDTRLQVEYRHRPRQAGSARRRGRADRRLCAAQLLAGRSRRRRPRAPAKPEAPALPFRYLGKMVEDGKLSVFLANGDESITVHAGERIGDYRVDKITESRSALHLFTVENQAEPAAMKKILALILLALVVAACATHQEEFKQGPHRSRAGQGRRGPRAPRAGDEGEPERRRAAQLLPAPQGGGRAALPRPRRQRPRLPARTTARTEAYGRVLRLDPENQRARRASTSCPKDREHRALLDDAQKALKAGDENGAQARLKQVLAENPQNKEARAMLRKIEREDRQGAGQPAAQRGAEEADHARIPRRAAAPGVRDHLAPDRPQLHLRQGRAGRRARHDLRARRRRIDEAMRIMLVTNQLDRKVLNENTRAHLPEHAGEGARRTRTWWCAASTSPTPT